MDDETDGWKASFCSQRPLLYVIMEGGEASGIKPNERNF
jgi:hypothetical protein